MSNYIRPISLAVLRRPGDKALLLDAGYDSKKHSSFYRPLGGGIDFGERSEEALIREFMEEIGKEIEVVKPICVDENIFVYNGEQGHQIMFVHECKFVNEADYSIEKIQGVEKPDNFSIWRTIEQIKAEGSVVYPEILMKICV